MNDMNCIPANSFHARTDALATNGMYACTQKDTRQ